MPSDVKAAGCSASRQTDWEETGMELSTNYHFSRKHRKKAVNSGQKEYETQCERLELQPNATTIHLTKQPLWKAAEIWVKTKNRWGPQFWFHFQKCFSLKNHCYWFLKDLIFSDSKCLKRRGPKTQRASGPCWALACHFSSPRPCRRSFRPLISRLKKPSCLICLVKGKMFPRSVLPSILFEPRPRQN